MSPLLIRERTYHPGDFGCVVTALTTVVKAAVDIGNPVFWT